MKNIFENAKFGDLFESVDGTKNSFCSFTKSNGETLARLYREGWGVVIFRLDGSIYSGYEWRGEIKCRYVECVRAAKQE